LKPDARHYYGPFALVGWLYLCILYVDTLQSLELDLLSSRTLLIAWVNWHWDDVAADAAEIGFDLDDGHEQYYGFLLYRPVGEASGGVVDQHMDQFRAFYAAAQAVLTLCFATGAGTATSLLCCTRCNKASGAG
jgi:hypothetical protein